MERCLQRAKWTDAYREPNGQMHTVKQMGKCIQRAIDLKCIKCIHHHVEIVIIIQSLLLSHFTISSKDLMTMIKFIMYLLTSPTIHTISSTHISHT